MISKDNKDLKKYTINDDPYYQRNGYDYVDIKCNSLHMALVKKIFGHFNTHYLSEVFGHHALMHEHVERLTGRELVVKQRQKKLHISHLQRLTYFEYRDVTTPFKQCRVYMLDESEAKRVNNTSIIREMMSMQVHCLLESEAEEEEEEVQDRGKRHKKMETGSRTVRGRSKATAAQLLNRPS